MKIALTLEWRAVSALLQSHSLRPDAITPWTHQTQQFAGVKVLSQCILCISCNYIVSWWIDV
jgi:succinate dehydrogenase/fumarate reductase-like Fe-S protein